MSKSDKKSKNEEKKVKVEDIYKEKTLHEHIYSMSDTYIGSITADTREMYVFNYSDQKMEKDVIKYIGGFYKIFDEIVVNARDQTIRDKNCKTIKLTIDKENGSISVWNDGNGIPVQFHKDSKKYVPEMIFGTLLTSSNYDQKGKITGGKNGYGAKCTNIYSKEFIVETVDLKLKKKYYQRFFNNMYDKEEPKITDVSKDTKAYTCITYTPDYEKFGMKNLTNDMYKLLLKRAYDLAACTNSKVKVFLNNEELKIRKLDEYIKLFYDSKFKYVFKQVNSRWNVGVVFDKDCGFSQVSFVNGICTLRGGTHVTHVVDQIVKKVTEHINSQSKYKSLKIKRSLITDNISVFIDAMIEDPGFDSQTKETLNTKISDFGKHEDSRCNIPDSMINELMETGLVDEVIKYAEFKAQDELKKTDGKKTESVNNIPKLDDAHNAGTKKSKNTRLFITEGDSAKAFAIAGLSVIGRENYGAFPIRGKFLNVRNATAKQILKNEEFSNLKKILGLRQGKQYNDTKDLRYGGIIILTDQDVDGSHIKGLILNMFATFWPSLLKIKGFFQTINTPILKAWKKTDSKKSSPKIFFTKSDFDKWSLTSEMSKWNIKYYKGLGTSTEKEAKEIFQSFHEKILTFIEESNSIDSNSENEIKEKPLKIKLKKNESDNEISEHSFSDDLSIELKESTSDHILLAFDKNKADNRKVWLYDYDKDDILEFGNKMSITYPDFINKDLKHFSNYDNIRSIPNIMDGFKPSQRKIMYACFKRGYNSGEIKVAQLAGYVAQHTEYHHNEDSLKGTIIGLAQNYVGSNNLNFLTPSGNFGYRNLLGKDHASPRYIFTQLEKLTGKIFREEDENILNYIDEDGTLIEPDYYTPIIPTILINGCSGIGTGFSTSITSFNPIDIINNIKSLLNDKKINEMYPWYKGFTGNIKKTDENKYISIGLYEIIDSNTVNIKEIPIGTSITDYKNYLDSHIQINKDDKNKIIDKVINNSGNNKVDFTIKFKGSELKKLFKDGEEKLVKFLKLTSPISLTNLHLYNSECKMSKYDNVNDIIEEFFKDRLKIYKKRIDFMINKLKNLLDLIEFKIKYIYDVINKKIKIQGNTRDQVLEKLENLNYPKLSLDHLASEDKKSYKYLTDLQLLSLTTDKIKELEDERDKRKSEYEDYLNTSPQQRWKIELDELEKEYMKWFKVNIDLLSEDDNIDNKSEKKKKKKDKKLKKN